MKTPEEIRDKLHALAIEADEMLYSCDASDILDTLEEARNAMTEGAEVIMQLMTQLQYSKDGLDVLLDEARKRDAELAQVKKKLHAMEADLYWAASPEGSYCEICAENAAKPCRGMLVASDCFRWRGVQEDA